MCEQIVRAADSNSDPRTPADMRQAGFFDDEDHPGLGCTAYILDPCLPNINLGRFLTRDTFSRLKAECRQAYTRLLGAMHCSVHACGMPLPDCILRCTQDV
mmetsp:Transcript_33399/g.83898  ORF Transcript_33399/g.83898 Transcript_33399/m.83898 type:complete len:101 (+) Transcript_33399:76-378(+)